MIQPCVKRWLPELYFPSAIVGSARLHACLLIMGRLRYLYSINYKFASSIFYLVFTFLMQHFNKQFLNNKHEKSKSLMLMSKFYKHLFNSAISAKYIKHKSDGGTAYIL